MPVSDPVSFLLGQLVGDAIKGWNDEEPDGDRGWRHSGYSEPINRSNQDHCAAWAEGLLCCTDPTHSEFSTLVAAIVDKLKPLADSLVVQGDLMKALRDIECLDTERTSPNSANWRMVLLYATQRARKALNDAGQHPGGTDRSEDLHKAHVVISKSLEVIGSDSPHDLATWVLDHLLEAGWDLVSPSQSLEDTRPASRQPSNDSP